MKSLVSRTEPLSAEMMLAAHWLALPKNGGRTLEDIAQEAGVSVRQLYTWRLEHVQFQEYVRQLTMANVSQHLPDIMDALTEKAKEGHSIRAVETWLKAQGMLQPEMIVRPGPPVEDRSDAAIEADIERLKAKLADFDDNYIDIKGEPDNE